MHKKCKKKRIYVSIKSEIEYLRAKQVALQKQVNDLQAKLK